MKTEYVMVPESAVKALADMQDDLLIKAEIGAGGERIVNVSPSVWDAFCEALDAIEAAAPKPSAEPSAEPVAWFAFADNNGPVPLELYGWDEKACKNAVLTNARSLGWKGTVEGYLFHNNWIIRPVYLDKQTAVEAQ